MLREWQPIELERLIALFNAPSKAEAAEICRSLVVYQSDLVGLILGCQAGGLPPLNYACSFLQRHPEHLIPSQENRTAFERNGVGPLDGKARKLVSKSFQMFEERRLLAAHLFYSPDHQFWHSFYFDQRDVKNENNHWKHGPHIHYVCDLFQSLSLVEAWEYICIGSGTRLKPIHIRYMNPGAAD